MNISYSAAYNKRNSFSVTDNLGNSHLYIRTGKDAKGKDRWFNIAKCEVLTDGHIDENDGLIPDAVPVHPEEVAYVVAQAEEYHQRLARAEASLRKWIAFSNAWKGSRKIKQGSKKRFQKKEARM